MFFFFVLLSLSLALRPPQVAGPLVFQAAVPIPGSSEAFSMAEAANWIGGVVPAEGDSVTVDSSFECDDAPSHHVVWDVETALGAVRIASSATCPTIVVVPEGRTIRAQALVVEGLLQDEDGNQSGGETRLFLAGASSQVSASERCAFSSGMLLAGFGTVSCALGSVAGSAIAAGNHDNVRLGCQRCYNGMRTNSSLYGTLAFRGNWTLGGSDAETLIYVKNNGFDGVFGIVDRVHFESVEFLSAQLRVVLTSAPSISSVQQLAWDRASGDGLTVRSTSVGADPTFIPQFATADGCAMTLCSCTGGWRQDCVMFELMNHGGLHTDKACVQDVQSNGVSVLLATENTLCGRTPGPPACGAECAAPRGVCLGDVFSEGALYCQCAYDSAGFGFGGSSCATPVCPKECIGGGSCEINEATGFAECVCSPGFFGTACQFSKCLNACSGQGTCDALSDAPVCDCFDGFYGEDCSSANTNRSVCDMCVHGTCVPRLSSSAQCVCDTGWRGRGCHIVVCPGLDVAQDLPNCNGRGSCAAGGRCDCSSQWTGEACSEPVVLGVSVTTAAVVVEEGVNVGLVVGLTVGLILGVALALTIVLVTRWQMRKRAEQTRSALIAQAAQGDMVRPAHDEDTELSDQFAVSTVSLSN